MSDEVLRIEGLRKAFGGSIVLDGITQIVRKNEVVCFIGASGSGKSTLLRCVNLLERIDAGEIYLGGQCITAPGWTRIWCAGTSASCSSPTTCSRT